MGLDFPSCLIIAGEKSGEEHALSFVPSILKKNPNIKFFGVGGDELASFGVELVYHLKDFSSWGIGEVIHKIPFYLKAEKVLLAEVKKRNCKTAVLIDFQDFNLKIAGKLKKMGVNVLYYVAPQAWAWKAYRTKKLQKSVHTLFCILPFEKRWFLERGVTKVKSVIHPLLLNYEKELQAKIIKKFPNKDELWKILLLPGSRDAEVKNLLPVFLEVIRLLKKDFSIKLSIVKTTSVKQSIYDYYLDQFDCVYDSPDLATALKENHLAIAASGTVTLATALFSLPTIVCYKGSLLTEFIYYNFIGYRGPISLTNIVHEEMIFPELIQSAVNSHEIFRRVLPWLTSRAEYEKIVDILTTTKDKLSGESFVVSDYMASVILGE